MNEERYILARFVQKLMLDAAKYEAAKGYNKSWNFDEICAALEEVRMEAVLGDVAEVIEEVE